MDCLDASFFAALCVGWIIASGAAGWQRLWIVGNRTQQIYRKAEVRRDKPCSGAWHCLGPGTPGFSGKGDQECCLCKIAVQGLQAKQVNGWSRARIEIML